MGLSPRSPDVRQRIRAAIPALSILFLAGVLVAGGEAARTALRYERTGLMDSELWRILTGHFVHLGPEHFLLNAAGLVLVALLVASEFRLSGWAGISAAGVVTISAGLWFLNPELEWYVGLSGLLHAWLAAGVVGLIGTRRPDGWPLAILLLVKLAIEQWMGPVPGSAETAGGPIVVDAHLYGAVAGVLAALPATRLGRRRGL